MDNAYAKQASEMIMAMVTVHLNVQTFKSEKMGIVNVHRTQKQLIMEFAFLLVHWAAFYSMENVAVFQEIMIFVHLGKAMTPLLLNVAVGLQRFGY